MKQSETPSRIPILGIRTPPTRNQSTKRVRLC